MANGQIHAKAAVMKYFALIAIALMCPLYAAALGPDDGYPDVQQESPLSESELNLIFKGQTHHGTYNFLTRDITSFAFEETTDADGKIRHVQQGKIDTGNWSISEDIICYNYDDPALRQACFRIYARGNCYYHFQVSVEGRVQYGFTARSVIAGETPNCEPSLV